MFLAVISLIVIVSLVALAVVIRDVGREISGMDAASKSTEERKNERIRKEIEKWRNGQ